MGQGQVWTFIIRTLHLSRTPLIPLTPLHTPMSALATFWRWMRTLAHRLAWLGVVMVALWLLLWAVLHVWIVPRIDQWRGPLAQWASDTLGTEVRIERIEARSTGWVPSFEFQHIRVMDGEGRQALHLPKVTAAISAPSLLQLDLAQLVFEAPSLELRRLADGHFRIAGWTVTGPKEEQPAWRDWLFSQQEVRVHGANITWVDEQVNAAPVHLPSVDAVLRNGLSTHRWRVDVNAPQLSPRALVWMGQFRGPLLTLHPGDVSTWQGQTYVQGEALDLGLLQAYAPFRGHLLAGQGALKLWVGWDKGHWQDAALETQLQALRLRWPAQTEETRVEAFSARAALRLQGRSYALQIQDLHTQLEGQSPMQVQSLGLLHQQASPSQVERRALTAKALDLAALQQILAYLPVSAARKDIVQQLAMRGAVKSLEVQLDGPMANIWDQLRAKGEIVNFSTPGGTIAHQGRSWSWPGLESADMTFDWRQGAGRASVRVKDGALLLPAVLDEPRIPLEQLQASWQWRVRDSDQGRQITVPQWRLSVKNADLTAHLQGSWDGQAAAGPAGVIDLTGQITTARLASLHRYLPKALPLAVRHYLRDAFVGGRAEAVQVRIKGPVAAIPFSAGGGEFRWQGRIRGAEMAYIPTRLQAPGAAPWPALLPMDGGFHLQRLAFTANLQQAQSRDWPGVGLAKVKLDIADMAHEPVLQLQSAWQAPIDQTFAMLAQSAIGSLLGGALSQAQGQGQAEGQLRLKVPLLRPEKSLVQGEARVQAERFQLNAATPLLAQAQGRLRWSERDFELLDAQGFALGGPVKLEGKYQSSSSERLEPSLSLRIQGTASVDGLKAAPQLASVHPVLFRASGQTPYAAQLTTVQGRTMLQLQSSLEGLALDWPLPLGKTAQQTMPLRIEQRLSTKAGLTGSEAVGKAGFDRIDVRLGALAHASYVRDLSGNTPQVLSGVLALGDQNRPVPSSLPLPTAGVTAAVTMEQLTVDPWLAFARSFVAQAGEGVGTAATPLSNAYLPSMGTVQAQQLVWDGRPLNGLTAGISREGAVWRASVKANELDGYLTYRPAGAQQQALLTAKLTHMNMPEQMASHVENVLQGEAEALPALNITVDAFQLRGRALGRLDIEAAPLSSTSGTKAPSTWQVRRLELRTPEAQFSAQGQWHNTSEKMGQTALDFVLDIDDAGALLTRLGMPGTLRRGEGKLDGRIVWDGSPLAPNVPSMRGDLALRISRGQFLQADPGVAKLLGVLSLQSLPRRLVLDFRDVFSEGFAFDSIEGSAKVARGIVRTDNLRMQGLNADVTIWGSANLQQETQDIRVVVVPNIDAGGASVLAAVAVNPLAGLGTFIAQRILSRPLVKSNTQSFHIDGSWSEPRVTRLESSSGTPPAALPAPLAKPPSP